MYITYWAKLLLLQKAFQEGIVLQLEKLMLGSLQILVWSVFLVLLAPVLLLREINQFHLICHVNLGFIKVLSISVVVSVSVKTTR